MASESEGGGGEGGEYLPSDLDEEAFLAAAYATDEDAYLQGATTGAPWMVPSCGGGDFRIGRRACVLACWVAAGAWRLAAAGTA